MDSTQQQEHVKKSHHHNKKFSLFSYLTHALRALVNICFILKANKLTNTL